MQTFFRSFSFRHLPCFSWLSLILLVGYGAPAFAIPPAETETLVASATTASKANTADAKAPAKSAKNNTKAAKNAPKNAKTSNTSSNTAPVSSLLASSAATSQLPSQKLEKHDILAQPSADFVCPHVEKGASATECFLDGVQHLYTVCRNVKAIELIEFGFAKAEENSNGFKSEFCRRKQKASMPAYFEAALREARATSSCAAAQQLNDLYAIWHTSMSGLRQFPQETEAEYKERIVVPYVAFTAYREQIRQTLAEAASQGKGRPCPAMVAYTP